MSNKGHESQTVDEEDERRGLINELLYLNN